MKYYVKNRNGYAEPLLPVFVFLALVVLFLVILHHPNNKIKKPVEPDNTAKEEVDKTLRDFYIEMASIDAGKFIVSEGKTVFSYNEGYCQYEGVEYGIKLAKGLGEFKFDKGFHGNKVEFVEFEKPKSKKKYDIPRTFLAALENEVEGITIDDSKFPTPIMRDGKRIASFNRIYNRVLLHTDKEIDKIYELASSGEFEVEIKFASLADSH